METSYEAPTMLPIPPEEDDKVTSNDPDSTYKNYDEKWNVEEEDAEEESVEVNPAVEKEMPATMVLVIGIILGAFVAMVLIVIIGNFVKILCVFYRVYLKVVELGGCVFDYCVTFSDF